VRERRGANIVAAALAAERAKVCGSPRTRELPKLRMLFCVESSLARKEVEARRAR
jgi:hypothetical protein